MTGEPTQVTGEPTQVMDPGRWSYLGCALRLWGFRFVHQLLIQRTQVVGHHTQLGFIVRGEGLDLVLGIPIDMLLEVQSISQVSH